MPTFTAGDHTVHPAGASRLATVSEFDDSRDILPRGPPPAGLSPLAKGASTPALSSLHRIASRDVDCLSEGSSSGRESLDSMQHHDLSYEAFTLPDDTVAVPRPSSLEAPAPRFDASVFTGPALPSTAASPPGPSFPTPALEVCCLSFAQTHVPGIIQNST